MTQLESRERRHVADLARILWNHLRLGEAVEPADAILVLGSADTRSAEWGAKLWLDRKAPLLVLSGNRGPLTSHWERPEAEVFAGVAERLGVPREAMVLETRSTNTGENVRFTRRLFEERGPEPDRWILVHTPYLERRTRATFRHYWPGKEFRVTSYPVSFEECHSGEVPSEPLVHRLVGEVHRALEYPRRGWQAPDEVPESVLAAWKELVSLGYDGHLVP